MLLPDRLTSLNGRSVFSQVSCLASDTRPMKVVFSGLPPFATAEEFKTRCRKSISLWAMSSNSALGGGKQIFGLSPFTVTLKVTVIIPGRPRDLQSRQVIVRTITVSPYRKPPGPIQFGHGLDNCYRSARCVRCGGHIRPDLVKNRLAK
ncbi:hypothetical protein J6590_083881 [Homalodisca vitripennis]|nr:hypothetical protein J6590_083881 [Homalodisca vitripennis]